MNKIFFLFIILIISTSCKKIKKETPISKDEKVVYAIVLHGGAGNIVPKNFSETKKKEYQNILNLALNKGYTILKSGGSSIEAVEKTITILEDSPLFNAGKGAVFDSEGKNKMDASIMDGKTLNSGAVSGVTNVKNPIKLAKLVLDKSKHVMLSGKGAEIFGEQNGIIFKPDDYFFTKRNYDYLMQVQKKERDEKLKDISANNMQSNFFDSGKNYSTKYGTVGVVALDKNGNLAAGTSTGGLTNKKYGRIGDSPIIGAGTYANNKSCAVSCTGVGEYYIRTVAAKEISSLIQYKNYTVQQALDTVLFKQIAILGGKGGMIVLDKNGNIAWNFNTKGMFRAFKKSTGKHKVSFFALDSLYRN